MPSPRISLIWGEGASGLARGTPLVIDQAAHGIRDEIRLVKRNEMTALLGKYLAAVRRAFSQVLLQIQPHFPELGRVHLAWHIRPPDRAIGCDDDQWKVAKRTAVAHLLQGFNQPITFISERGIIAGP